MTKPVSLYDGISDGRPTVSQSVRRSSSSSFSSSTFISFLGKTQQWRRDEGITELKQRKIKIAVFFTVSFFKSAKILFEKLKKVVIVNYVWMIVIVMPKKSKPVTLYFIVLIIFYYWQEFLSYIPNRKHNSSLLRYDNTFGTITISYILYTWTYNSVLHIFLGLEQNIFIEKIPGREDIKGIRYIHICESRKFYFIFKLGVWYYGIFCITSFARNLREISAILSLKFA